MNYSSVLVLLLLWLLAIVLIIKFIPIYVKKIARIIFEEKERAKQNIEKKSKVRYSFL